MQNFTSVLPWSLSDIQLINGKEIPVNILVQWDYCDTEIEGDEEYIEQFTNGNYVNCYIVVKVYGLNHTNCDRIYGIHCKVSSLEKDLIQTIIDHNMIENAKQNLEKMILTTIQSMKEYGLI